MTVRTVNITLLEQTPQVRILRFTPDLTSVDGDLLIAERYEVTTDEDGIGSIDLPVKASGTIRWIVEIPRDGGVSSAVFYLAAGSAIDLADALAAGEIASQSVLEYVDAAIAGLLIAAPASAGASGIAGQIAKDTNYLYICVATNTWKRTALATW